MPNAMEMLISNASLERDRQPAMKGYRDLPPRGGQPHQPDKGPRPIGDPPRGGEPHDPNRSRSRGGPPSLYRDLPSRGGQPHEPDKGPRPIGDPPRGGEPHDPNKSRPRGSSPGLYRDLPTRGDPTSIFGPPAQDRELSQRSLLAKEENGPQHSRRHSRHKPPQSGDSPLGGHVSTPIKNPLDGFARPRGKGDHWRPGPAMETEVSSEAYHDDGINEPESEMATRSNDGGGDKKPDVGKRPDGGEKAGGGAAPSGDPVRTQGRPVKAPLREDVIGPDQRNNIYRTPWELDPNSNRRYIHESVVEANNETHVRHEKQLGEIEDGYANQASLRQPSRHQSQSRNPDDDTRGESRRPLEYRPRNPDSDHGPENPERRRQRPNRGKGSRKDSDRERERKR